MNFFMNRDGTVEFYIIKRLMSVDKKKHPSSQNNTVVTVVPDTFW
jgi:hypothetical protein